MRERINRGVQKTQMAFRGQIIQFAWFLHSIDDVHAPSMFNQFWGADPDLAQTNRAPGPANPFLSIAGTSHNGVLRQIQVQPGRVDLVVNAELSDDPEKAFANLFNYEAELYDISTRLKVADNPLKREATRLSTVVTMLEPVGSYTAAAKRFFDFSGFKTKAPNLSDLGLQLNSRKTVDGVDINRVVGLSVFGVQVFSLSMSPGVAQTSMSPSVLFAARRMFDFNTVPDGRTLKIKDQLPIFDALVSEILRVSASGTLKSLES